MGVVVRRYIDIVTSGVERVALKSGIWRDQSDRLVCNQHYVMH